MRPTSLAIKGLKCWTDRTFEFGQLTAIQGPNGSGKTAIIQAIRLALLGYDPETGRKLDQTRKLIAPDAVKETADIGLSFSNGFGIRRRFGKTAKTQVLPSRGETTGAACQQRIDEETGGLVVSLDLGTFFDLSAEKRRAWLFEHLPTSETGLEWETFVKWIDPGGLGDVVRNLWEHNVQAAPNAAIGLSSAIETARREFLEADQGRQSQGKVVERGAEVLREGTAPEPVEEGALQEVEERLASTNQRIGETRAGREAREAIEVRIRDANAKGSKALGDIAHTEHLRDDLAAQLGRMEEPDTRNRADELADLEGDIERLQDIHEECRGRALAKTGTLDELERQKKRVEEYGPCPYALLGCEQDTEGMRDHILEGLDDALVEARDLADTQKAAEVSARSDSSIASERAAHVRIDIRAAADLASECRAIEQRVESKAVVLQELEERAEIHVSARKAAEAELEALGSDDVLAGLYETRATLVGDQLLLQKGLEGVVRHSERLAAHERELAELKDREQRADALKELDGNLRRLRAHVIKELVEPLQEEANKILATMDPQKTFRFIFERGNASTLELCFVEDGVTRLFDAASKGERVMLTIAFLGALLAVVKPAMRLLIIDDLEQLDDVRRPRLMAGLVELRDRFDAVIVAGACELGGVPGWDLVDLEAVTVTA
ncbi:MAG: AAA family ATPase [Actinomycetota bacterium]|nr:AAA family ATPase [Actinomycetota bacterium]